MPTNYSDPRLQRAEQAQRSKNSMGPSRLDRTSLGAIQARHAAYQESRKQQFQGLAHSKRASNISHEMRLAQQRQTDRGLTMGEQRSAFNQKFAQQGFDDNESRLNQTMLLGGLGLGMSTLEGMRRDKVLKEGLAADKRRSGQIDSLLGVLKYGRRTDEGALMGARSRRDF